MGFDTFSKDWLVDHINWSGFTFLLLHFLPFFVSSFCFYLFFLILISLIRKFVPPAWRDNTEKSILEVRTLAGIRRDVLSIHCTLTLCPLWLTGLAAIQVNLHRTRHGHYSETKQLHIDIQWERERVNKHTHTHRERARPRGTPLVNSGNTADKSIFQLKKKKSKLVNNCPSFISHRTEHLKTKPAQAGLIFKIRVQKWRSKALLLRYSQVT